MFDDKEIIIPEYRNTDKLDNSKETEIENKTVIDSSDIPIKKVLKSC